MIQNFNKRFLILTAALILGVGTMTVCASTGENIGNTDHAATGVAKNTSSNNNKRAENKVLENKSATETNQDAPVAIYDGRVGMKYEEANVTDAEKQFVTDEFKRSEAVIKQKFENYCNENDPQDIYIDGVAEGSFTKPKSSQKVFLYTRCSDGGGNKFGIGGIMVVENGKVAAHYVYGENGLANSIFSLPDINKNGLSEIVLIDETVNQGVGAGSIRIYEYSEQNLNFFGQTDTHSDDEGKDISTSYKISVQPSTNPVFFRETYQQKINSEKWSLSKKSEKFSLDKTWEPKIVKID